ncbi:flagellar filament capping protein FliD [uncultured Tyzzerella sp.]|uniref:flagellar filament capping protein FliD n=1 Tax=uncultured Tyzzerella sp. TaxID=2321398 RepID=UPI0029436752|nr:flagellar filament capping protein FliD [uncultured Tyzzerella sp.]
MYTSNINRVTGLSGFDTEGMVEKLMQAESAKKIRLEKDKIKVGWEQEAYRNIISATQDFKNKWLGTNVSNNIGYDAFWNNSTTSVIDKITGQVSNAITIKNANQNGNYNIEIIKKAEAESITGNEINAKPGVDIKLDSKLTDIFNAFDGEFSNSNEITLKFGKDNKEIKITKDDTIRTLINKVNSSGAGIELGFNELTKRFTLEALESGNNSNIDIQDVKTKEIFKKYFGVDLDDKSRNAVHVEGQDAEVEVDGIKATSSSNDIEMNGISFTINSKGSVNISSNIDVDSTFNKIKDFVNDYNKLIDTFNKAVRENRPKSDKYSYYEPMTDEEKKGLTEDEIKKYEEQAKKGFLYRSEHLDKFLRSMRDNVYKSIDIGGKNISLYEIGITTSQDYNSGGKLEIDEEKLKQALRERSGDVKQLFTSENGIASKINKSIDDAIGVKGYLTQKAGIEGTISGVNNDLTKEIEEIAKKLAEERQRLYDKENYYYNLFAKMEQSMNQQNTQMGILLSSFN